MTDLTDKQKMEYFHRSYLAVDGLWFMKIEENFGFETALKMDEAVWKILPKIQSRIIKAMMNHENGPCVIIVVVNQVFSHSTAASTRAVTCSRSAAAVPITAMLPGPAGTIRPV